MTFLTQQFGKNYFEHGLSRQYCQKLPFANVNAKDIRILCQDGQREIKDIIIIDNNDAVCFLNFHNFVPITDYVGQMQD
jgi:hypothetical protein